jgi:catechol 2,3-dioxygenase-like lactoylglutathione lyase family enzyme
MLRIASMDHIVLNVKDIDASLHFYTEVLGLQPERVEEFRSGKIRFPSVRVNRDTILDLFQRDAEAGELDSNLNHFCLVWDGDDVETVIEYLRRNGVETDHPPTHAWGAKGRGTSIRVHDPDGNTVELRTYGGEA